MSVLSILDATIPCCFHGAHLHGLSLYLHVTANIREQTGTPKLIDISDIKFLLCNYIPSDKTKNTELTRADKV